MLQLEVIGNLGHDAEIKNINSKEYLSFSVAHSEKKAGVDRTTWIRCLKMVRENDKLGSFLKKGAKVFVSGSPYSTGYAKDNDPKNIISDINLFVNQLEILVFAKEEADPMANVSANEFPNPADDLPF